MVGIDCDSMSGKERRSAWGEVRSIIWLRDCRNLIDKASYLTMQTLLVDSLNYRKLKVVASADDQISMLELGK